MMTDYSFRRLLAIIIKEFNQLKRDSTTFSMIIGIPLVQIIFFGFAINTDAKHFPTAIIDADKSQFSRSIVQGFENTSYISAVKYVNSSKEAERLMNEGKVSFILNIPTDFSRKLIRKEQPHILLEVDATDATGVRNAVSALNFLVPRVISADLRSNLTALNPSPPSFKMDIHAKYNPTELTQYYVVPGLLGVILTMTLVMVTAMTITKERERGTIENLLITPARPIEVIIGKAIPNIIIGYAQTILVLAIAHYLFDVPILGSITLLMLITLPFILTNLLVGIAFSTIADNQLQASQMSTFFFLPSMLLSGFAFPFHGMPGWAQWVGNLLPMTHYVNITRSIMLKGGGWDFIWHDVWPILIFMVLSAVLAVSRYKQTLD